MYYLKGMFIYVLPEGDVYLCTTRRGGLFMYYLKRMFIYVLPEGQALPTKIFETLEKK